MKERENAFAFKSNNCLSVYIRLGIYGIFLFQTLWFNAVFVVVFIFLFFSFSSIFYIPFGVQCLVYCVPKVFDVERYLHGQLKTQECQNENENEKLFQSRQHGELEYVSLSSCIHISKLYHSYRLNWVSFNGKERNHKTKNEFPHCAIFNRQ